MDEKLTLQQARQALDRPGTGWAEGLVHHGARVLLLVALAVAVGIFFPVAPVPDFPQLERGMVPEEDVIAEVGFSVPKSPSELAREREEAAATVVPVFRYDSAAVGAMTSRVESFFARVDSAVAAGTTEGEERAALRQILSAYGIGESVTPEALELLRVPARRAALRRAALSAVRAELPRGIASSGELEDAGASQLEVRRDGQGRVMERDSVVTQSAFIDRTTAHLPPGRSPAEAELLRLIAIRFVQPSIRFDARATEAARERARQAVAAVKGQVQARERIVSANVPVGQEEIDKMQAYRAQLLELDRIEAGSTAMRATGALLYDLLVLSLFGLLLYFFRPTAYGNIRHVLLLAFLILALTGAAAVVGRTSLPVELIPIAFPALVIAALWDGRMALNFSLIMAVLLAGQAPFVGVTTLLTMVMGGAAAALSVRVVRRRAQTWGFGAIIALAYLAAAITMGLLRAHEFMDVLTSAGWGAGNAVGSALLAMGFLPVFEGLTRITTDQTLLELSDLNRPLLKRLALEAPGTYAHSINVANLAEAAARGIGANALLTRVGVYYHDVGKVVKPQYFIENQPQGRNPHDKLKPSTSAAVVRGHVLEGLRLADEAKLPDAVKAFIAEHHGTQTISYFYEKAKEADPEAELNPRDFSYPGPKPQSKETAILMIADACESAARVLPDPTPDRIRDLVNRLVDARIAQGQLGEAPLTLAELSRVKDELVGVLSGVYHHRIDYPTMPMPPAERAPAAAGRAAGPA